MSLHCIVEPAGTLMTGWNLVTKGTARPDIRNCNVSPSPKSAEVDQQLPQNKPDAAAPSKWEREVR